MPLILRTIPCLRDNYAFLLNDPETGNTACIDVPEAAPIERALDREAWRLTEIWLTHHHDDHIAGVDALRQPGMRVVGAEADAHRLPQLDLAVGDGDVFQFGPHDVHVFDVSGHTIGHVAFHVPEADAAFSGDSLMAMGCGRLFEGDPDMMWTSLQKLTALPPQTMICSGHEYTAANARFAASVDTNNPALVERMADIDVARSEGRFTVPSRLDLERATNPFLRAADPDMAAAIGLEGAEPATVFAELRRKKDVF